MKEHSLMRPQSSINPMNQSDHLMTSPRLVIFVYGTLKSGQANHDRFCGNAIRIKPATTIGRLYALPAGYPALEVPEQHILAHGTADPSVDAETLACFSAFPDLSNSLTGAEADWGVVHGELVTFAHPVTDLPPIDRLEGFHPGQHSYYRRVLVPAFSDGRICYAWIYVMPVGSRHMFLPCGCWPSPPAILMEPLGQNW